MTTAASVFAQAMGDVSQSLGAVVTYCPLGTGDEISMTVSIDMEIEQSPDGFQGGAWSQVLTIEGLLSDFTAEPNIGDEIHDGDTVYTVKRVLENDGIFVKVAVK
jgi:hypothetical protein